MKFISRGLPDRCVLIADQDVSVSWECSHVPVIDLGGGCDLVNLVMRRVGYCALVKRRLQKGPLMTWKIVN